jgi:hypothetical protein
MDLNSSLEFSQELLSKFRHLEDYDKSLDNVDKIFSYGTCGFRYNENELDRVYLHLKRLLFV